jgi:ATP-dependent helicase YprA (DUF1998 family)
MSQNSLDDAADEAASLREKLLLATHEATTFTAKSWQLDAATCIYNGTDLIVHVGTGEGKSLPFVMPLFVRKEKMVIILAPLSALKDKMVIYASYISTGIAF